VTLKRQPVEIVWIRSCPRVYNERGFRAVFPEDMCVVGSSQRIQSLSGLVHMHRRHSERFPAVARSFTAVFAIDCSSEPTIL
jgi:hypothetical protein